MTGSTVRRAETHRATIDGVTVAADLEESEGGRMVITRLELTGGRITSDVLRQVKVSLIENAANLRGVSAESGPLQRPDGTDPDAFARRVAAAYMAAAAESSHPAKALAELSGVPVTTVHRWVREARLRGHLPAGQKGRAG